MGSASVRQASIPLRPTASAPASTSEATSSWFTVPARTLSTASITSGRGDAQAAHEGALNTAFAQEAGHLLPATVDDGKLRSAGLQVRQFGRKPSCVMRFRRGVCRRALPVPSQQAFLFRKAEHQVHVLNGLSCRSFYQIIDHADDYAPARRGIIFHADVAEIGALNGMKVRKYAGIVDTNEWLVSVEFFVGIHDRFAREPVHAPEINRLENAAIDGYQLRDEAESRVLPARSS